MHWFVYHLIVNMIESQNADCVDVLLSATRAPTPVVTGGDSEMILSSDPDICVIIIIHLGKVLHMGFLTPGMRCSSSGRR